MWQQPCPVCLSEKNHMPDCCCSCWNVLLSNCCTNFSDWRFPCYFFFRGGSVCLSWLLEPSLSIKRTSLFCYLFWWKPWVCQVIHWYCNTKMMSAVVYIIRPSVVISFYFFFFPLGDLFCRTWLACFIFLWLLFGNKTLQKKRLMWLCPVVVI